MPSAQLGGRHTESLGAAYGQRYAVPPGSLPAYVIVK